MLQKQQAINDFINNQKSMQENPKRLEKISLIRSQNNNFNV